MISSESLTKLGSENTQKNSSEQHNTPCPNKKSCGVGTGSF